MFQARPAVNDELLAKYNYKVNPSFPLDGPELPLTMGDKLKFVSEYDEHWWMVRNQNGEEGDVPAKYMMVKNIQLYTTIDVKADRNYTE